MRFFLKIEERIRLEVLRKSFYVPWLDFLAWILIGFGSILYLSQYLANRSLWFDEAMVAVNVIKYPVEKFLHQPLPYCNQAAPFEFLVIEKAAVSLWGVNEYALRVYPLICGIGALACFFVMARQYLHRGVILFALFGFLTNSQLTYYVTELKPYSGDVFWTLLSYVVLRKFLDDLDWYKVALAGIWGMTVLWFSFPVVFTLLGILTTYFILALFKKDTARLFKISLIFLSWGASLFLIYILINPQNICSIVGRQIEYWISGYLSFTNISSWWRVFSDILKEPFGFSSCWGFAGLLFLVGIGAFYQEDKKKFLLLFMPLFWVWMASGLHIYSCKARLVLFLTPSFILIILNGVRSISSVLGRTGIIVTLVSVAILFFEPAMALYQKKMFYYELEGSRAVMAYVSNHSKDNDRFVLCTFQKAKFDYYSFLFGTPKEKDILDLNGLEQNATKEALDKLRFSQGRVWLLFSPVFVSVWEGKPRWKNDDLCVSYLSLSGSALSDSVVTQGASAYLFDLEGSRSIIHPQQANFLNRRVNDKFYAP